MIEIVPAIDLIDGRCVRLSQGDYAKKKVYDTDPAEVALRYRDAGVRRIHIVDLDGAKAGRPVNLRTLEKIASAASGCELEWGGGLASADSLRSAYDAGATHLVIGSVAALRPELFRSFLSQFGAQRLVLGADIRDGRVSVKGWTEDTALTIGQLIESFLPDGLSECVCTDISRDGMLQGPSFGLYSGLQSEFPQVSVTVSGGIGTFADVEKLDSLGLRKVIIGKAIYEGRITLKQIEEWSLNA